MVIFSTQDGNREKRSWSAQHLISTDTGHRDSSVITISVAPAALHADEPDDLKILDFGDTSRLLLPETSLIAY